ncbi:MAG: biosynthetic-type acetolactate synthase large subunit [Candidatus Levybacteria bacterium]|nr:biosynthetic-type acetolactate synthase large subunit [Candidatus Levybacteria bacterium]
MKISGSQALMRSLVDQGVDIIFGYPGGAIMPVYDALYDYREKIRHILVRHEQGAVHAAEGYARMRGRPGVCLATSGPGATNLVTGIADAIMDSVPLVCITGQVYAHLVGTDAFQEADVIGITTPISKWNHQITQADEVPEVIAKAFYIAGSGRPGPVVIDITKNAQVDLFDYSKPKKVKIESYKIPQNANRQQIKKAAEILNSAEKPMIIVGHGVQISKAEKEIFLLAAKSGIPIASTLHGISVFPTDHPLYVGMVGMHGKYGANVLTNQADAILAVGMRFDDRVVGRITDYAKEAKIIHIDIDDAELNKNIFVDLSISADAKKALMQLIPLIKKNKHEEWVREFRRFDEIQYEKVTMKELNSQKDKIKMAQVINMLSDKTKGQSAIVADVGQHQMITANYYNFKKPNSFMTSGGLGTMGFALPAAIGAKLAAPRREVIAVIGDGSFQMNIQELATVAQEHLSIKIIILNNNYLGMVRQWQQLFFDKRYSFVDLKNPDFIQVAKGFRIDGEKVEKITGLSSAIDRLLQAKKSYILEVVVEKEGNVFPMVPVGAACDEVVLE